MMRRKKKKAKMNGDELSQIPVSSTTQEIFENIVKNTGEPSIEKVMLNLLEHPDYSMYCRQYLPRKKSILLKLPFQVRMEVILFVPKIELKYIIQPNLPYPIKSCQSNRLITMEELMREYFGYFREDRFRKTYLIFKRIAVKTPNFSREILHKVFPKKNTLVSVRLFNGEVSQEDGTAFTKFFPDNLNQKQFGLECLILNGVTFINMANLTNFVELFGQYQNLKRVKISDFTFPVNPNFRNNGNWSTDSGLEDDRSDVGDDDERAYRAVVRFTIAVAKLRSVTILGSRNVPLEGVRHILESGTAFKIALGSNSICQFPVLKRTNFAVKFLFLQNNDEMEPMINSELFPNLTIVNVSNTRLSIGGFVELLRHPNLRKAIVSRVNFIIRHGGLSNAVTEVEKYFPNTIDSDCEEREDDNDNNYSEFSKIKSRMEILNLNHSRFPGVFLKLLQVCENLAMLHVAKTDLSDNMALQLDVTRLDNLSTVSVAWNRRLGSNGFTHLLALKSLKKFVCPQTSLSVKEVKLILSSNTIKFLSLRSKLSNPFSKSVIHDLVRDNKNLKYLNVTKQHVPNSFVHMVKYKCINVQEFKYTIHVKEGQSVDVLWKRPNLIFQSTNNENCGELPSDLME